MIDIIFNEIIDRSSQTNKRIIFCFVFLFHSLSSIENCNKLE